MEQNPTATLAPRNAAKTRHSDVNVKPSGQTQIETILPPVPWQSIGQSPPVHLEIGERKPDDPLPIVDYVIITWTSAEWFALDHIFLNSQQEGDAHSHAFRHNWHSYTRGATGWVGEKQSGQLWGHFQLVEIANKSNRPNRVLLFKSNAHLAHAPWIAGLSAMMQCILEDTQTKFVYTIGTAGGARLDQSLGDAVITNSAVLKLQRPQNVDDPGNGMSYRCPTWYPTTSLLDLVENNLLYKLDKVANAASLEKLFAQLKRNHAGDTAMDSIELKDLINDALSASSLAQPKIHSLEDVPLLTTDFYYVANGNNSDAFSFLEMDDAVVGREANKFGIPWACIRNVSDPIVPGMTRDGAIIPASIRNDWSGMIYTSFGLFSSYNGALATWATIAGSGSDTYNPSRGETGDISSDPLEVQLAFKVRSCGTCSFFWPEEKSKMKYGPYTSFDFDVDAPYPAVRPADQKTAPWVDGRTGPPSFPNGEIIDGCRKAPIMTLGINPNLTAFAPGQNGAPWAYPHFTSDHQTNAWAKYAWYYRYRSVYQEKLDLAFVKQFVLPEGAIKAAQDGVVVEASRPDDNPTWSIQVQYAGDQKPTTIVLPGRIGDFPYMLFYDSFEPNNAFHKGDVIAGRVAVPEGIAVPILQEEQGYYMQFVPTLNQVEEHIRASGHDDVALAIGEDVSQIDMVACASPHWNERFLDGDLKTVVDNCVRKNAWAVKQIVQSQPSVLYVVSESSWRMFRSIFGKFVDPGKISTHPSDHAYTLFRETSKIDDPVYVRLNIDINGVKYNHIIRLVITPHFSFSKNFMPQYRMSPKVFEDLSSGAEFQREITAENGFTVLPADPKHSYYYREIQLDPATAIQARENLKHQNASLFSELEQYYFDPHQMMAEVMIDMYDRGELTFSPTTNNLTRTQGACSFCVNRHWQFKNECRYGKNLETAPPADFLEQVAQYIIENGG